MKMFHSRKPRARVNPLFSLRGYHAARTTIVLSRSGFQSVWGGGSLAGKGIISAGDPAEEPSVHKSAVDEEIEGFCGHENTNCKDAIAYDQRIAI